MPVTITAEAIQQTESIVGLCAILEQAQKDASANPDNKEAKELVQEALDAYLRWKPSYTGRYGQVAMELWRDSQRVLHLNKEQADRLCTVWQVDIGRAMVRQQVTAIQYGIPRSKKSEGMLTLKEAVNKVQERSTYSLSLAATVIHLDDCRKFGTIDSFGAGIVIKPAMMDWLNRVKPDVE